MEINFERVGDLVLTVRKNDGEKFYGIEDILEQSGYSPRAMDEVQIPIKFTGRIIFGYRSNGCDFIQSVFVDKAGLKAIKDFCR